MGLKVALAVIERKVLGIKRCTLIDLFFTNQPSQFDRINNWKIELRNADTCFEYL